MRHVLVAVFAIGLRRRIRPQFVAIAAAAIAPSAATTAPAAAAFAIVAIARSAFMVGTCVTGAFTIGRHGLIVRLGSILFRRLILRAAFACFAATAAATSAAPPPAAAAAFAVAARLLRLILFLRFGGLGFDVDLLFDRFVFGEVVLIVVRDRHRCDRLRRNRLRLFDGCGPTRPSR